VQDKDEEEEWRSLSLVPKFGPHDTTTCISGAGAPSLDVDIDVGDGDGDGDGGTSQDTITYEEAEKGFRAELARMRGVEPKLDRLPSIYLQK
jgi:hypothetical protein